MGGGKGGKGGGSAPQLPPFVTDVTQRTSEVGRQIFDIAKPGLTLGGQQAGSLISTGGPGARVPILQRAVAAQQRGTMNAQKAIGESLNRGSVGNRFSDRILNQVGRQGEANARNIPIRAALPLITGSAGAALGGSALGSQAFAGGTRAIAGGLRQPMPSNAPGGADALGGALSLFGRSGSFPIGGSKNSGSTPSSLPSLVSQTPQTF